MFSELTEHTEFFQLVRLSDRELCKPGAEASTLCHGLEGARGLSWPLMYPGAHRGFAFQAH